MVTELNSTGSVIVSWDFSKKDQDIMLIGVKEVGREPRVINVLLGQDARDMHEKLTTRRG